MLALTAKVIKQHSTLHRQAGQHPGPQAHITAGKDKHKSALQSRSPLRLPVLRRAMATSSAAPGQSEISQVGDWLGRSPHLLPHSLISLLLVTTAPQRLVCLPGLPLLVYLPGLGLGFLIGPLCSAHLADLTSGSCLLVCHTCARKPARRTRSCVRG